MIDDKWCEEEKPKEEECVHLWLWTSAPDDIAISGTLLSEEPVVLPRKSTLMVGRIC
jgi:hypothetical protein